MAPADMGEAMMAHGRRGSILAAAMTMAGLLSAALPAAAEPAAPTAVTAAAPGGFDGIVCVQASHRAMRWGVRHAVREWNSVPVGPRLVLRERCGTGRNRVRIDAMRIPGKGTGVAHREEDGSYHVILNTGSLWQYPTDRWCVKGHTSTHELGHVLGLPHFPSRGDTVMGYANWWEHCGDLRPADRRMKRRQFATAATGG